MEIVIKIPKEFEEHFNSDRFEDTLQRIRQDIKGRYVAKDLCLSGNYEIETIDMLIEVLKKCTPLPEPHGDLVDRDTIEVLRIGNIKREYDKGFDAGVSCMVNRILETPTIIEADKGK